MPINCRPGSNLVLVELVAYFRCLVRIPKMARMYSDLMPRSVPI